MNEDQLHGLVAQFLKLQLPGDAVFHHSPNGMGKVGWRSKVKLSRFGTMTGWPDIEIVHQGRIFFIELKAPGGDGRSKGYLNPNQKTCHLNLRAAGAPIATCRSLDEVKDALFGWNLIERAA